jgi:hypothetical protein
MAIIVSAVVLASCGTASFFLYRQILSYKKRLDKP